MIGIKGMGGGGKTTLARAVYDRISTMFEGKSFVENVREVSQPTSGLKKLQKRILKDVLNKQDINCSSVHDGRIMLKDTMRRRKTLVVLDDVDRIEQLEALAGSSDWFKSGSRIIITTRDEQVLLAHGVNFVHEVNLLSYTEAICLLSRYAFRKEIPIQGYEELSGQVLQYADGLPLTIKVLGSFLCCKDKLEWVDVIDRLKKIPLKDTLEKIELSYNSLEDEYKEIFLDIACILKGEQKDKAIRVLESCGFHARTGLKVLEQRSFLTISLKYGQLVLGMHDHIEEMGKNVVRRLHPDEPNKHSRLWNDAEIKDILANDKGTEATRCLELTTLRRNSRIVMKGLVKMKKLRYLEMNFAYYDVFLSFWGEDTRKNFVDYLYQALKDKAIEDSKIYIIVFSKNYASSSWCLEELVNIMECQKMIGHIAYPVFYDVEPIEVRRQSGAVGEAFAKHENEEAAEKWKGALKEATNLAGWELKNTSDGHEAKFIRKLVEELSLELRVINSGVDGKLISMGTQATRNAIYGNWEIDSECLRSDPKFDNTSQLDESTQYFPNSLEYLKCTNYPFLYLPKTFQANNLVGIEMDCRRMVQLWEEGEKKVLKKLKFLSLYESNLTSIDFSCQNLNYLDMNHSKLITFDLGLTPNFETLSLDNCADFVELRVSVACPNLKFLNLCKSRLRSLDLELIPNLERLYLEKCYELVDINAPVGCLKKVGYLNLSGCLRFTEFVFHGRLEERKVSRLATTSELQCELKVKCSSATLCPLHPNSILPKLQLHCSYDENLPSSVGNIEKLMSFGLCACTDLKKFSDIICSLQCLHKLTLQCNIPEFPKDLGQLECLEELHLSSTMIKHLPDGICMLKRLKSLEVNNSDLLEKLPEDLGQLECLEELYVSSKKIEYLPDSICMLKRLKILRVKNGDLLEKLPEDLGQIESLERLCVISEKIEYLPDSICMLKRLKSLYVTECHSLGMLPKDIGHLECLEDLILSSTKIKHLPDSICMLKHLKFLKLDDCSLLKKLPEDLGKLECLEKLDLYSMKIEHLSDRICMLKRLKFLRIDNGDLLEKLPEDLGKLECLEKLYVSSKKIEYLPDSICMLKRLKSLYVTKCCRLGEFPEDVGQLKTLEILDLSATNIKHLPDSICMLKHLNYLNLHCCALLEKLHEDLGRLECLEHLDITGISDLPQSIFGLKGLLIAASSKLYMNSYL